MEKEKLEELLEYINDVIKGLSKNDGDRSFYYYQRDEIERKLKECEENDRENEPKTSN